MSLNLEKTISSDSFILSDEPYTFSSFNTNNSKTAELFFKSYHGTTDDEGETLLDWEKELSNTVNGKYGKLLNNLSFTMSFDGKIIGSLISSTFHEIPLILYVVIHPDFKGKGLSKLLMREAIQRAKSTKIEKLYLVVTTENLSAFELYKKIGFTYQADSWDELS